MKSGFSRFFRHLTAGALVVVMLAGALVLAGGAANAQPVTNGLFAFSGDPGDYISGGGSYSYSAANDSLTVASSGNHMNIDVRGANSDRWTLDLAAPSDQTLVPGTYNGATRYPFQAPTVPGLSLTGNGRGCNTSTGSFVIQNVVFGPGDYVEKLDVTYEQHCEGGAPALRGEVHIADAPPPSQSPDPSPIPSPSPSPSPSLSVSLAFSGDPGDYISLGGSYSYSTAANDSLTLASNGNHISVNVRGANSDRWTLDLAAPSGQTLVPGSYNGATRYPFQAPTAPGLDLSGNGRGCSISTGSFVIQNVVFGSGNNVEKLDATYEEHCEGATPALRGQVHVTNAPSSNLSLSGSLAFSGDQGDSISGGKSYDYSTAVNDRLNVNSDGNHIDVAFKRPVVDWWNLNLAAPRGQTLALGTYNGATRYPFEAPTAPGLSLAGNGRDCNTLTGSFTIQNLVFGPDNNVEKLDATYEQHCEGATPALRGEVHIANASSPSPSPGAKATTTTLKLFPNPAFQGLPVLFLANVTPSGASGTIQFMDGTTPLGAGPVPVVGGFAFLITRLPAGTHSLTAKFTPTKIGSCPTAGGSGRPTPKPCPPPAFMPSTSSPVPLTVQTLFRGLGFSATPPQGDR